MGDRKCRLESWHEDSGAGALVRSVLPENSRHPGQDHLGGTQENASIGTIAKMKGTPGKCISMHLSMTTYKRMQYKLPRTIAKYYSQNVAQKAR